MNEGKAQGAAETAYIVLVLAVAIVLWWEAGKLPPAPYDPLGPGSFPRWASYGLGALGIAMALRRVLGHSLGEATHSLLMGLQGDAPHVLRPWTAVLTLVLSVAYAAALSLRSVPFMAATAVYLFAAGMVLGGTGRRKLLVVGSFAVLAAFVLDVLFRRLFNLDLS